MTTITTRTDLRNHIADLFQEWDVDHYDAFVGAVTAAWHRLWGLRNAASHQDLDRIAAVLARLADGDPTQTVADARAELAEVGLDLADVDRVLGELGL